MSYIPRPCYGPDIFAELICEPAQQAVKRAIERDKEKHPQVTAMMDAVLNDWRAGLSSVWEDVIAAYVPYIRTCVGLLSINDMSAQCVNVMPARIFIVIRNLIGPEKFVPKVVRTETDVMSDS